MSTAEMEAELSILMNNADENDNNDKCVDKKRKLRIETLRIALVDSRKELRKKNMIDGSSDMIIRMIFVFIASSNTDRNL